MNSIRMAFFALKDIEGRLMACTCPHHIDRNAYCTHMAVLR